MSLRTFLPFRPPRVERTDLGPERVWPPPDHAWHPRMPPCLHGHPPEIRVDYDDGDATVNCPCITSPCLPYTAAPTLDLAESRWIETVRAFAHWTVCPGITADTTHRRGNGPHCPHCQGINRVPVTEP